MVLRLLVLVLLLASGAASAQAPAPAPSSAEEVTKSVAGAWEMSNAERDRSCTLTLKGTRAGAGASGPSALELDAKCAELFPFTRGAAGWIVGSRDAIRLVDAKGQPLLEFTEVESGLYEAERPGEGLLFLQNVAAAAGDSAERTAAEVAGDWDVMREGAAKALCRITLKDAAAGGNSTDFGLQVGRGCDASVTRFSPSAWRLDRGQLVLLSSRAEPWRFEESDPATWRRIPEGPNALRLVRAK